MCWSIFLRHSRDETYVYVLVMDRVIVEAKLVML